jgi:hypothetical protein
MSHIPIANSLAARTATFCFGCGPRSCFVLLTEFSPPPAPLLYIETGPLLYIETGPTSRRRITSKNSYPFMSYLLLPLPLTSFLAASALLGIYHNWQFTPIALPHCSYLCFPPQHLGRRCPDAMKKRRPRRRLPTATCSSRARK